MEKLSSRERVARALSHRQPDRVPVDFGNSSWTGIHARAVEALRDLYGLPQRPIKVWEPYQFLGEVDDDLLDAMGVDTVRFQSPGTSFGFRNENWKEFKTWWGQTVLVSEHFLTAPHPDNGLVIFPEGDTTAPPSGHMPMGSYFFDTIIRQEPFDADNPRLADNLEEFSPIADDDLRFLAAEAKRLADSARAPIAGFGGTALGDIFAVPAPWMKRPRGIRDIGEWYMSLVTRPDFVERIFDYQLEVGIENLTRVHQAVGDVPLTVQLCGADFGTQESQFCSLATFKKLWAPRYKKLNAWVHEHTNWKTMKHSCGSVRVFIDQFIDCGFDVLNPVQISAKDMDPKALKRDFGDRIAFWGGGIDTQRTLPYGTPAQVREEALRLLDIFAPGGGYVFNTVHNVMANIPVANLAALIAAVKEFNGVR